MGRRERRRPTDPRRDPLPGPPQGCRDGLEEGESPVELRFPAEIELVASAAGKPPRISILAYNGGIMPVAGSGSIVVDLSGLTLPATVPLLGDHISTLDGVAGSGQPSIRDGRLLVEGTLADTPTAAKVMALHKSSVPLQASVGLMPETRQSIRAGEVVSVNGKRLKAGQSGLTLIKSGTLREVSILPLGADASTTVHISARSQCPPSRPPPPKSTRPKPREPACSEIMAVCGTNTRRSGASGRRWLAGRSDQVGRPGRTPRSRPQAPRVPGSLRTNRSDPRDVLAAACLLMADQADARQIPPRRRGPVGRTPRISGWPELRGTHW